MHFFQREIRQKMRDILSEKRESGMALKKREFTPESGTVDTYVIICTFFYVIIYYNFSILTTNLAECVCVCAKCDPFLPLRFHFFFKLPDFFFRIAKFPYAAFGPLFAFHCPIFFTKNNTLNGVCMLNVTAAH